MAGRVDQVTHSAAIARWETHSGLAESIRVELGRVLGSPAFQASQRSCRFLSFIVESAIEHRFDLLKERTIGLELFDRPADYDTNADSIVRVTATDVRKRLFEHYASTGRDASIRIHLPQGSYLPDLEIVSSPAEKQPEVSEAKPAQRAIFAWVMFAIATAAALWFSFDNVRLGRLLQPRLSLPWSAVFEKGQRTQIVIADTSIAALQDLSDSRIELAAYASRKDTAENSGLSPEMKRIQDLLKRNHFTSAADASIAARLAQNFGHSAASLGVVSARNMQIRAFHSPDNFILIGSAYANPWVQLFSESLGLTIEYDPVLKRQICRDKRPGSGQPESYIPTAKTGGDGEAYAVVSLVRNPGQSGHVLLLAGTSMEGTETAGEFASDARRFEAVLVKAGIEASNASPRPFEALLKLKSMAGSASSFEIVLARQLEAAN